MLSRAWLPLSVSVVAFLISLVTLFIRLAPIPLHEYLYNADLLYLPSLFEDIAQGGSLWEWRFSNAPYLFPDILLFGLLWVTVPNMFIVIALFGAIQIVALIAGFACLAWRTAESPLGAAWVFLAGALCCWLATLNTTYSLLLTSVFHVGLLVVMPFALLLAIRLLGPAPTRPRGVLLGLGLLTALTVASDPLYLFQVALPMGAMIALLVVLRIVARGVGVRLLGVLLLAVVLGVAFERLTQPMRGQITGQVALLDVQGALDSLWLQLPLMFAPWPWLGLATLLFCACALWVLIRGLRSPQAAAQAGIARLFVLGTLLGGFGLMLVVMLLSGRSLDRYMLNVLYLGPVLGWPLLIPPQPAALLQRGLVGVAGIASLAALLLSAPFMRQIGSLGSYGNYYPPLVACVDEAAARYGVRSGIAQYWQARPISMLSQQGVRVVTVNGGLGIWHWLNSLAWYDRRIDFAIVDHSVLGKQFGFTEETLITRFGDPAEIVACADSDLYIYNRSEDAAFRNSLRPQVLYRLLDRAGQVVTLPIESLPGRVGQFDGQDRVVNAGTKGYILLTDWLILDAGSYLLSIDYQADDPNQPGWIEVSGKGAGFELELTDTLLLPAGRRMAETSFVLEASTPIQIHVYTNGGGRFTLEQVNIARIR